MKMDFTERTLDFGSQKLRLWWIGLTEFDFLKMLSYLHEICQFPIIHLQSGNANLLGQSRFEGKSRWEIHYLPKLILKFHKQGIVSDTGQYLSWKLVSEGKFSRVLWIFSAIARNPTRGVSWSKVTRFSILDFSIGFPIFFQIFAKNALFRS